MIGHLRGTLFERHAGGVIIECGGVGYDVSMSGYSLGHIGPAGSPLALRVFTHAQENRIALYGFTTAEERALFDLLITVKNVGPASAMKILSTGAQPAEIAQLIAAGKTTALQGLRGVGKKTAELLVVELRDRCQELLQTWGQGGAALDIEPTPIHRPGARSQSPLFDDVASALGQLGWRPGEVEKAMAGLAPAADATFEGLLRQALRQMPR